MDNMTGYSRRDDVDYRTFANQVRFEAIIRDVSTDRGFDTGAPYTSPYDYISCEIFGKAERVLGTLKDEDYY